MKTLIFSAIASLLLVSSTFSAPVADKKSRKERREMLRSASSFSTTMFINKENKLNVLVFKYGIPTRTIVSLRDKGGNYIYREYINANRDKFGKVLVLNELDYGTYTVEVSANGVTEKKTISISERTAERTLALK